jgi:hypothetical protein
MRRLHLAQREGHGDQPRQTVVDAVADQHRSPVGTQHLVDGGGEGWVYVRDTCSNDNSEGDAVSLWHDSGFDRVLTIQYGVNRVSRGSYKINTGFQ